MRGNRGSWVSLKFSIMIEGRGTGHAGWLPLPPTPYVLT